MDDNYDRDEAWKICGPACKAVGVDRKEFDAMMVLLVNVGVNTSTAACSFRRAIASIHQKTKT